MGLTNVKRSGPRKTPEFYLEIVELYRSDPVKGEKAIDLIPTIGYYKDYLYLLEVCDPIKDKDFEDYMYNRIVKMINKWDRGKHIILSKWLPREKSSFDMKLNFVKKISLILFPNDTPIHRKKKYRQLVSKVCSKLNTLESNLCAKTYDKIKGFTESNLNTYEGLIDRNKTLRNIAVKDLKTKYKDYPISKLLIEKRKKPLKELRHKIIEPVIESKITSRKHPMDTLMILNISGRMFNNSKYKIYEHALIYANNHSEMIMNGFTPKIIGCGVDNVDQNMDHSDSIDLDKIKTLTDRKYSKYIIVSDIKTIESPDITWRILDYKKPLSGFHKLKQIKQSVKIPNISSKDESRFSMNITFILLVFLFMVIINSFDIINIF